jgi:hypothetical protein
MLYERTAISRKPEELIQKELELLHKEGRMTPDLVFRDPYLLISLVFPILTVNMTLNLPSFVNWKDF